MEHQRLQQLQDGQHVGEEGEVVVLAELLQVEVHAALQQPCDHGQVPAERRSSREEKAGQNLANNSSRTHTGLENRSPEY